ncbi:MAG: phosphoribosylformylglycinamidine synthase subunit PurQ [Deinococcales bacterium]
MKAKILILHASGTNRHHEAKEACELSGASADIVHMSALKSKPSLLDDYQALVLAGGFSYGDALGAGKRLALELNLNLQDSLQHFNAAQKGILGICNGFQALVQAGLLPALEDNSASLSHNNSGHFECRWVRLMPNVKSLSPIIQKLKGPIYCPAAHGEGRFLTAKALPESHVAFYYQPQYGQMTIQYPDNPNGSQAAIAGVSNARGNILGLMPHPENHIYAWQHPRYRRGEVEGSGLALFQAFVDFIP